MMNFKGSRFEKEIILWGVRWYVAYPISYRGNGRDAAIRCNRALFSPDTDFRFYFWPR
jgi:hypothetical protein